MFKKLFQRKNKKQIDLKTKAFFQFAKSIHAVEDIEDIEIEELIMKSSHFLQEQRVVSQKMKKELLVFKDQYNRYLQYCIENKVVNKEQYPFIEELQLIQVPDMSHIKVPDISKEIKELDLDLENLSEIFSNIKFK